MGGAPGTASSYLMQSNYDMDIYGEAPEKMTYTEQANKRAHCKRLTWYTAFNINCISIRDPIWSLNVPNIALTIN